MAQKGKRPMRMEVIHGSRVVPKDQQREFLAGVSERMNARRLHSRLDRIEKRHSHSPERLSVEKAMLAVEERIVRAYWVLARLPNDKGIGYARRNGVDYMLDRDDRFANAVSAGGKWEQQAPRPATPSGKDIDAMQEPFEWLRWLDEADARILAAGAMWKRGDAGRNVNWIRAKAGNRSIANFTNEQLKQKYRQALRTIVAELTARRLGRG
jgi:hypothetical protein